jgi:hypothetical protein
MDPVRVSKFITPTTWPLIVAGIAIVALVIRFRNLGQRPKNYPPGPPTIPILGTFVVARTPAHLPESRIFTDMFCR